MVLGKVHLAMSRRRGVKKGKFARKSVSRKTKRSTSKPTFSAGVRSRKRLPGGSCRARADSTTSNSWGTLAATVQCSRSGLMRQDGNS
jgi:hypothetical protein